MSTEDEDHETYIGDGLYASFDGWQIKLRAPQSHGDQIVFLEPTVLRNLMGFAKDIFKEDFQRMVP